MARALVVVVEVLGVIPELAEVVILVRDVPHDVGEGDGSRHASGADLQEPVLARVDVQHGRVRGEVAVASDGAEWRSTRDGSAGSAATPSASRCDRIAAPISPDRGRVREEGDTAAASRAEAQWRGERATSNRWHLNMAHTRMINRRRRALGRVLPLDNGLFQGCARRSARKPSPPARA